MPLLARFSPLLVVLLLLAGCASGPRIRSDFDPQTDFTRYRSFAFHTPLAVERDGYATPASTTMREAARREMEARGYVYDEAAPDLLVNLNAYVNQRSEVVSLPEVQYGWYYSYRAGAYVAVPHWGQRTAVHRYTEGTLNVDLVDAAQRRLVWEGEAEGRIVRLKDPEARAERIRDAIADIFAAYPHRAP